MEGWGRGERWAETTNNPIVTILSTGPDNSTANPPMSVSGGIVAVCEGSIHGSSCHNKQQNCYANNFQ